MRLLLLLTSCKSEKGTSNEAINLVIADDRHIRKHDLFTETHQRRLLCVPLLLGYVHTNTDGRRRTFFRPSVAVVAFITTRTAPDGRKKMARTKKQKLMLWWWWRRRVNKVHSIRRFSVHPVNRSRHVHGEYHHLIPVLLDDPFKFAEYLRMNPDTFHDLLEIQGRI